MGTVTVMRGKVNSTSKTSHTSLQTMQLTSISCLPTLVVLLERFLSHVRLVDAVHTLTRGPGIPFVDAPATRRSVGEGGGVFAKNEQNM